jgi:hypothetical protein
MSSKLFAFNVSKKIEKVDEKAPDQWVGDQTARAFGPGYCTGSSYGVNTCFVDGFCYSIGGPGFYLCDSY